MNRNPRIRTEFAKQETKAAKHFSERSSEYYRDSSLYEGDRKIRLEAYKAIHGSLPVNKVKQVSINDPSLAPLGFQESVKLVCVPTRVEKPVRRTVMKYRPTSV